MKLRMEAKGNSGVILSEFFYGMFLKLKEDEHVHPRKFVEAMGHGKEMAYAALAAKANDVLVRVLGSAKNVKTRRPLRGAV